MAHTCDRDTCPRENVNGPKAKCFSCKKQCFLACYGVSLALNQITAYDQLNQKNQLFTPTSNIQFLCTECLSSTNPSSQSLNDSISTPKAEKLTIRGIMQEVTKLQDQFASLHLTTNEMNQKLDSIEGKTNDIKLNTEAVMNKTSSQPNKTDENNTMLFGSPSLSTRQFRPQLNRKATTYASITRANGNSSQYSTPMSTKRRRNDVPVQQPKKPNVPAPKMGTNTNAHRLVAIAKPEPKKVVEKPKFEKAVWVSRLAPSITEEDIRDYITTNTSVTSNFTVRKLVAKDRDVSSLNFISFKIAVNLTDFDILNDPIVWPQNVLVREFVENNPVTFGAFLPNNLNVSIDRKSPEQSNHMEIASTSPKSAPRSAPNVS